MIFLIYKQNLTTIGPVVSEITCLIKMDTDTRQIDRRTDKQTDRQTDRQTDGKYESGNSADELDILH